MIKMTTSRTNIEILILLIMLINISYIFLFFVKNILMFITHVSSNIYRFVSASINGDCFSGFRTRTVCGRFYRIVINKIYYYCCPRLHETFKLIHVYIMFMLHRSKLFLNSIDANSSLSLINQLPANRSLGERSRNLIN